MAQSSDLPCFPFLRLAPLATGNLSRVWWDRFTQVWQSWEMGNTPEPEPEASLPAHLAAPSLLGAGHSERRAPTLTTMQGAPQAPDTHPPCQAPSSDPTASGPPARLASGPTSHTAGAAAASGVQRHTGQ